MARSARSPTKARKLDSFFPSASPVKRTAPTSPTSSPRKAPRIHPARSKPAKEESDGPHETLTLVDSPAASDGDDSDDLIVLEPSARLPLVSIDDGPPTQGAQPGSSAVQEHEDKPSKERIASIFAKVGSSSTSINSTDNAPPLCSADPDHEVKPEVKPEVKASPVKNISFFDTLAAAANARPSSSSASTTSGQGAAGGGGPGAPSGKPLDTPLFSFDPATNVSFGPHRRTPFSFFTDALVHISGTRSRLAIQLVLTNLLRTVIAQDPDSLLSVLYLCSNRIGPSYERDTELGIGWQVLSKAIKETSGITPQRLKQLANKHGDPGDIAFEASKSVRLLVQPAALECHGVYRTLLQIAKLKGTGVLAQKTSLVKKLLLSAQGEQVRFIIRILASNLRIGAVRLTLLTALARAFCLSRPESARWVLDERYELTEEEREGMVKSEAELFGAQGAGAGAADFKDAAGPTPGKGKAPARAKPKTKPRAQRSVLELAVEDKLKRAEGLVRRVWARHPNLGDVVGALLVGGLGELEQRVGLSVGIPLEPMLGSITRSLSDIYTRLGSRPFVSEAKLDGQRGQIHGYVPPSAAAPARPPGVAEGAGRVFTDAETGQRVWVRVFSRHLEDMTEKYPDIGYSVLALVQRADAGESGSDPLSSFVIDCEVVAVDPHTGAFKTFQELSYRSKKDVELGDIKVRVGIFCFDLMLLNGESLLSTPFRARRELLHTHFPPLVPTDARFAKWELIPSCMDNHPAAVKAFFNEALAMRAEGIMVKLLDEVEVESMPGGDDLDEAQIAVDDDVDDEEEEEAQPAADRFDRESDSSEPSSPPPGPAAPVEAVGLKSRRRALPATYEPDKRADSWLKCKKDYLEGESAVGDSLDLVPIAAWHGQGRKAGWWSPFLLACYDEETGAFTAVTKCLSGFTDVFYKSMFEKYSPAADNPLTSRSAWPEVEAGGLRPDIWFKPGEVWEIRGADFTLSPVYPAARGSLGGERGVSIRFPRFIRVREDKGIENATTADQLAGMYEAQAAVGGGSKTAVGGGAEMGDGEEE